MVSVMKTYAVYCKVNLVDEPIWLKVFRSKYDKPYDFHVTLKQPAVIQANQLPTIKGYLAAVLESISIPEHKLRITFDKLVLDESDDYDQKGYIFIFSSKRSEQLDNLQYEIRNKLSAFSNYLNPSSNEYEFNFNPHITIARELEASTFDEAVRELPKDYACQGEISEIILSCVDDISLEHSSDPGNLTVYKL